MRYCGLILGVLLVGYTIPGQAADPPKPTPPTIEALAAYPQMSGFSVAPSGRHIAALEGRGEERVILVWDTANLKAAPTVIGSKVMKIQSVQFIKDDVLAVQLWQPFDLKFDKTTKTFATKLYFTDLQGSKWREPLPLPRAKSEAEELEQSLAQPTILDTLVNDPDHVLVVNDIGVNQGDIYQVNVRTDRAVRIQRADEGTFNYVTDLQGVLRSRSRIDTSAEGSYIATEFRDPATGAWAEHFRSFAKDRDVNAVLAFGKDPGIAYIARNVGRDKTAIYEYHVSSRQLGSIAFEHKLFDASSVAIWRVKGERLGEVNSFGYDGPTGRERYFVAPWLAQLDATLSAAFDIRSSEQSVADPATGATFTAPLRTGRTWQFNGISNDTNTAVVRVDSPSEAPTYYLLRNQKELSLLARAYPAIEPAALGDHKLVYYRARDGLQVPAFLHTPNAQLCGAGPWPAVVHPHGGPWSRDYLQFDGSMWVPLMVSRCMAVLQPQYRGTADGWGRRLWVAGDAEWGQKMQDDKDDGVRWMIEQKIAIAGRVAMFGFSYGGYASMAAAVRPNGLYKCAIAGAGVSDIDRIWARFYRNAYFRDRQASTVKGLSPLSQADKISIPIYVYHGDRDQIVPIAQSQWFVNKAKNAGRDVVYREFKDYAHGPAWTRQIMGDQLRGIEQYLTTGCGGRGL